MKLIVTPLLLLGVFAIYQAQTSGKLTAEAASPKAGTQNWYTYQPHAGLAVPDGLSASIVYKQKDFYMNQVVPLAKAGNAYRFFFTAPDSTPALLICITDGKKQVFDNNDEQTFVVPLSDVTGKTYIKAGITAAQLRGYAEYLFKLKPQPYLTTRLYETAFKNHPSLKTEDNYVSYLLALNSANKDSARPTLVAYAKQLMAKKTDERHWLNAYNLYNQLGSVAETKQVQQKIVEAFPKGTLAPEVFMSKVYNDKELSTAKYLAYMHDYFKKFGDSSVEIKDRFYSMIISYCAEKKDWDNVDKYDALVTDKLNLSGTYNNIAWGLSGEQIDNAGTDLNYAATLSQRALGAVKKRMDDTKISTEEKKNLQKSYDMYADTYALILYKQNKVDSAFYYEDAIDKTDFYDAGRDLYARAAEKVKGPEFARKYIEEQLLAGVGVNLLPQLQNIYKQLNLPQDEFEKIKTTAANLAKQKVLNEIKQTLGSLEAKDFALKDLNGNTVTLSSLRDKVVVLDFWATWCMPCRASFPAMQEAVTKYKDDKDVVFLFLDVWERGDNASILKNTAKFIADNKYSFHVLIDYEGKVTPDYKVDGIPDKFVIDKQGNVVFMGHDISNLAGIIESAKG